MSSVSAASSPALRWALTTPNQVVASSDFEANRIVEIGLPVACDIDEIEEPGLRPRLDQRQQRHAQRALGRIDADEDEETRLAVFDDVARREISYMQHALRRDIGVVAVNVMEVADARAFQGAVGARPQIGKQKLQRGAPAQ